jgi:hypothetical protein
MAFFALFSAIETAYAATIHAGVYVDRMLDTIRTKAVRIETCIALESTKHAECAATALFQIVLFQIVQFSSLEIVAFVWSTMFCTKACATSALFICILITIIANLCCTHFFGKNFFGKK